ncbi:MAG: hypothetical protein M1820_000994 [Bogoriella megaspora]|nr:MAG: hypothetical protein M1820_000994 [Bogoriella megaspora]
MISFIKYAATALVVVQLTTAHTLFTNFYVDGIDQGNATCVRMPMTPSNATNPINNLLGNEMACGYGGETGVARVCPTNAGTTITFEWRTVPDNPPAGSMDISHKGPCAVYLKKVDDATKGDAAVGDGWFKIWDDGYDESAGKWCTEKLRDNNGHISISLPKDIEAGYYLLRPELLALHQADKTPSNPQFYVGCAQIFFNSTATSKPANTVSIPGYIQPLSPPVKFNIWTEPLALPYPMPGPPIYTTTPSSSKASTADRLVQRIGLAPPSCILQASNWCGTEVSQYTTSDGCWNASSACFAQAKTCYDTAPPTGGDGCRTWEQKCDGIQAQCQSAGTGAVSGPPDYMKNLGPSAATLSPMPEPSPTGLAKGSVEGAGGGGSASSVVGSSASSTGGYPSAASAASPVAPTGSGKVSLDGACGGAEGQTCKGSTFGNCCSGHGYCGSDDKYCGEGCQSGFGSCGGNTMSKLRAMKRRARFGKEHL